MKTVEQANQYVATLNMLFVNGIITRAELRAKLKSVPYYKDVCQDVKAKRK